MRKILLTAALLSAAFGFSQQSIYISELLISPPGDDAPNEYIELRGPAGTTINNGTYIVAIEGDLDTSSTGSTGNPGDVENSVVDLSGLVFGSNGYLVIATDGNPYTVNPNATLNTTAVTDTTNEDNSHTIILLESATAPTSSIDIDSNNDGIPDGTDYASWTILDSISVIDDDDRTADEFGAVGEYAYGLVAFVRNVGDSSNLFTSTAVTVFDTGDNGYDYFARIGESTGHAVNADFTLSDWFAGDVSNGGGSIPPPDFAISSTAGRQVPDAALGQAITDNIGGPNPSFIVLSTGDFSINGESITAYQPTSGTIAINGIEVDAANVYALNGAVVAKGAQTVDVSTLATGIYILQVESNGKSTSKTMVVK